MADEIVFIDVATSGVSGDMFLSGLLNLLGDKEALVPVAASLLIYDPTLRVNVKEKKHKDITGFYLEVTFDSSTRFTPAQLRKALKSVSEEVELSKAGVGLAEKILEDLFEAESRAHDEPIDKIHLHELGTVDTLLDIIGVVYLLERAGLLGKLKFIASSVAIGNGTVTTEHGEMEVPVPAVAEILVAHDMLFHSGDIQGELLTPTGAAILANLAQEYRDINKEIKISKQGIGFGTKAFEGAPNFMKLSIGTAELAPVKKEAPPKKKVTTTQPKPSKSEKPKEKPKLFDGIRIDEVAVIETNVDDADGETISQIYDVLLADDLALDVVVIPAIGKKNRPCYIVKVIAPKNNVGAVAEVLLRYLGTLGVRYTTWSRIIASREIIVTRFEVDNKVYMVRVKVSRASDGSIVAIKPEADDVIAISRETGIPVRDLKPRIALQAHAVTE